MFSAREPAERSSDPTLEVQELATTHWSEASAAGGAFVVGVCEALQRVGHPYCHPLYAFRPDPDVPFQPDGLKIFSDQVACLAPESRLSELAD